MKTQPQRSWRPEQAEGGPFESKKKYVEQN